MSDSYLMITDNSRYAFLLRENEGIVIIQTQTYGGSINPYSWKKLDDIRIPLAFLSKFKKALNHVKI